MIMITYCTQQLDYTLQSTKQLATKLITPIVRVRSPYRVEKSLTATMSDKCNTETSGAILYVENNHEIMSDRVFLYRSSVLLYYNMAQK